MTHRRLPQSASRRDLPRWLTLLVVVSGAGACSPAGHPDVPVSSAGEPAGSQTMTQGAAGLITDESGAPLAGVFLQLKTLDAAAPAMPEIAIVSGEDGRFLYALPPGRYEITVVSENYGPVTRSVTVLPGQVVTLDFVMQRAAQQP